ncbi:MAG TPA: hypothetical protein VJW76_08635 [Verrucomicrobiae bacterium]|nr:hypothetical protein [Verrucomicrobiae bacterium]
MRLVFSCLGLLAAGVAAADSGPSNGNENGDKPTVIVAVGAAGEEEFGKDFEKWVRLWEKAGEQGGAKMVALGLGETNATSDVERLKQILSDEPKDAPGELWLVLIGHGTFDGKEPKFNLRGPDLSAAELGEWLKPFRRRTAVINSASSSGPFINKLSASGRVVVTATRSGYEQNYARFSQYISEAIGDAKADLDKDGQVSLLEAFLTASRRVAEFYEAEGRLATEHALLDDNGDGLGTPADWFRGIRAVKKASDGASLDGLRAHQLHLVRSEQEQKLPPAVRVRRDELELAISKLRESKGRTPESQYYEQLERMLVDLAKLYEQGANPPVAERDPP